MSYVNILKGQCQNLIYHSQLSIEMEVTMAEQPLGRRLHTSFVGVEKY